MKPGKLSRLIAALCLMAAMVAILLAAGVIMYMSVKPEPAAEPVASDTPAEAPLTTAEDLLPDRTRLFRTYDGVLTDEAGREVSLAEMRGKPVCILFWSSWCGDCKDFFAGGLTQAMRAAEDAGAVFLLAAREGRRGETRATAQACLDAYGLSCSTLMDPDAALFTALGLRSVPSLAVLNADGVLMHTTSAMPDERAVAAMVAYAADAAAQTEQFLRAVTENGGVASSTLVEGGQLLPRGTVLSETQGLMMHYALAAGDKALFDTALGYVRNSMTRSGLTAWQTDHGAMAAVNATLDDLRIVEALALAQELWGGYEQELAHREKALYNRCLSGGLLVDFVDLTTGQASETVTLCYQDAAAMRSLASQRTGWLAAADTAQSLLQRGVISPEFPLYWPKYDAAQGRYYGDLLQMNEAMVTVLNAQRAGVDQTATLDWLEARLGEGYVAAAYTPDGSVAPGYEFESTATYALLVQIALEADRPQMALLALQEMERMRAFAHPLAGGYGGTEGELLYTFDVMQALLAWQRLYQYK